MADKDANKTENGQRSWLPAYTVLADMATEFEKEYMKKLPRPISTGWTSLDEKLGGGLMPGLYVLGAISSLGKSTFALQLAENIARMKDRRPVLYFSMEMDRRAIAAKSIARGVFLSGGDVQSRELLFRQSDKKLKELDGLIGEARESMGELSSLRVYTPMDSARPLTAGCIAETVRSLGGGSVPVVVVDYLQIIPPEPLEREYRDSRMALDRNIQKLRGIENAVVLVISALNRDAYYEPMGMSAFKESGSIEYSADVLMGLEFSEIHDRRPAKKDGLQWLMEQKQKCPRLVDISILKQRYGESNVRVPFRYYQNWDFFQQACDEPYLMEPGHAEAAAASAVSAAAAAPGGVPLKMNNTLLAKELRFLGLGDGKLDRGRLVVTPFPADAYYNYIKTALFEEEPFAVPEEVRRVSDEKWLPSSQLPIGKADPAFRAVTYWDMMVADGVFSVFQEHERLSARGSRRGLYTFRANDVLRVLSGDPHKQNKIQLDGGSGIYAAIRGSIEKMRKIRASVYCGGEMARRSKKSWLEGVTQIIGEDFLRLWVVDEGHGKGMVADTVYSFYDPKGPEPTEKKVELRMCLYQYAMMTGQVLEVPAERLATPRGKDGKAAFSDSVRSLTVKHYVARSVGIALGMRTDGETPKWRMEKLHLNTDEGLFTVLGLNKRDGRKETRRKKDEAYKMVTAMVGRYRSELKVLTPRQELPGKWPNSLGLAVRRKNVQVSGAQRDGSQGG